MVNKIIQVLGAQFYNTSFVHYIVCLPPQVKSLSPPIIISNVNGLTALIKMHRVAEWIKKTRPILYAEILKCMSGENIPNFRTELPLSLSCFISRDHLRVLCLHANI